MEKILSRILDLPKETILQFIQDDKIKMNIKEILKSEKISAGIIQAIIALKEDGKEKYGPKYSFLSEVKDNPKVTVDQLRKIAYLGKIEYLNLVLKSKNLTKNLYDELLGFENAFKELHGFIWCKFFDGRASIILFEHAMKTYQPFTREELNKEKEISAKFNVAHKFEDNESADFFEAFLEKERFSRDISRIFMEEKTDESIRLKIFQLRNPFIEKEISKMENILPEMLIELSKSRDLEVRGNVAWNKNTPKEIWSDLLSDDAVWQKEYTTWPVKFGALNHEGCPAEIIEGVANSILASKGPETALRRTAMTIHWEWVKEKLLAVKEGENVKNVHGWIEHIQEKKLEGNLYF